MMSTNLAQKNMIEDARLENVTGGEIIVRDMTCKNKVFMNYVDMYHGVVGQNYYLVEFRQRHWLYGTLLRSYESPLIFGCTARYHEFHITMEDGKPVNKTEKIFGEEYYLFTNMKE